MSTVKLVVPAGTPAYVALTDQLRSEILSGQISHGKRLTVAELVGRYGFSQMPVREALQALQGEGLITILPHRGARVLSLTTKYIRNVYEIRSAIEVMLAKDSLQNVSRRHIQRIEAAEERFAVAAASGDDDQVFLLNREFHFLLYSLADNDEAVRLYDHYNSLSRALRRAYGYSSRRRDEMVKDHDDTLEALRTQDEEGLIRSIQRQSNRGMDDLIARLGQQEPQGSQA